MNGLIIFGAQYLFLVIILIAGIFFLLQPRDKQKEFALLAIMSLPLIYGLLKVVALFYFDPRPFVAEHFTPLIPHVPDNGFPSDHTIVSASLASLLFPFNKKVSSLLWLLTLLVAISRIVAGIHHPVDVLASMLIAIVVVWPIYTFIVPKIMQSPKYRNLSAHNFTK